MNFQDGFATSVAAGRSVVSTAVPFTAQHAAREQIVQLEEKTTQKECRDGEGIKINNNVSSGGTSS